MPFFFFSLWALVSRREPKILSRLGRLAAELYVLNSACSAPRELDRITQLFKRTRLGRQTSGCNFIISKGVGNFWRYGVTASVYVGRIKPLYASSSVLQQVGGHRAAPVLVNTFPPASFPISYSQSLVVVASRPLCRSSLLLDLQPLWSFIPGRHLAMAEAAAEGAAGASHPGPWGSRSRRPFPNTEYIRVVNLLELSLKASLSPSISIVFPRS